MKLIIEDNVGETRAALYDGKKCVELYLERWSEKGHAFPGDIFSGRIRTVDTSLSAAFVDLGTEPQGFLNFTMAPGAPKFREGQMVRVSVAREAEQGKGPILSFIEMSDVDAPIREQGGDLLSRLNAQHDELVVENGAIDDFEAALDRDIALKGGGVITIEPTKAITAIDVDTEQGGSKKVVSLAAAKETARQIRLRGIGGLILIDFPNFRKKKDRDDVWQCLADNLEHDPQTIKLAPMSRFGTVELSRSKPNRSIPEMCEDRYGQLTPETQALLGLARLEREGRSSGGAQLVLHIPKAAFSWLMSDKIDWRAAMTDKLGARFDVVLGETMDVTKDR